MSAFKRVFRAFPGLETLLDIESVNILDIAPPGQVLGAGTGVVLLVAEFENGKVDAPTEIFGTNDLLTKMGGLGKAVADNPYANPVAVKSGGDELWNGNGFVWIRNKKFSGLIVTRVDNSAGSVDFGRLACLTGGLGPFTAANAGTVTFTRDGATPVTAIFNGLSGSITAVAGTFPTLFVGGETLEIKVDADATRVVVMSAAEQTLLNVVDRINAVLAQDIADDNAGELRVRSAIEGGAGRIEVVGGTARATLGLATAAIQQVDTATINANTIGGNFTLRTTVNVNGVLTDFDGTYLAGGGDTVTVVRDNLLLAVQALNIPGVTHTSFGAADIIATGDANIVFTSTVAAEPVVGEMTIALTTPGVFTAANGTGNVPNLASIDIADAVPVFDALVGISARRDAEGNLRVCNSGTPGTGTLQGTGGTELASFGFDLTTIADAANGEDVTIPAGTRVQDATATATIWITMSDIDTGTAGGPFNALVRPASDDDTALASAIGNVTLVLDDLPDGFTVLNSAAITRLSASQLDARYKRAMDATLADTSVSRKANLLACARTSPSIMRSIKTNVIEATASGLAARKGIVRPPIGTTREDAKGLTGSGIGAAGIARDERIFYLFPAGTTQIPEIQSIGTRGGVGFTNDGVIQVGADSFYCAVRSILPPEENAGQRLSDTNVVGMNILTLEHAYEPEQAGVGLTIDDYKSFKLNGIIALRNDRTSGFVFQSDVTSVDPQIDTAKIDANRRFFADLIMDTLGTIGVKYSKKLNTPKRNRALIQETRGFLRLLQSPNQPETSRLHSFEVFDDTTDAQFELGVVFVVVKVKMFPTMKAIVFHTEVGTSVVIEEAG